MHVRKHPLVQKIFERFSRTSEEEQRVILEMAAIGQLERVFAGFESASEETLSLLLKTLVTMDRFYREIGGILGYQEKILRCLRGEKEEKFQGAKFHSPSFIDLSKKTEEVEQAILWGLEAMPQIAEVYPLGGAADRLHLVDEKSGFELPAAKLPFLGRPLLEHLIRDLEAREALYERTFGKKLLTPIAIMTSHEKNNHEHVLEICQSQNYFGRPKELFRLFTQPLVPAVDGNGNWCMAAPLKPVLKPNGHGALWKLAKDEGILSWLESLGRTKCLVRQINNPLAGLDYGLLAFCGIGCKKKMVFGFASAPRLLRSAEGVNVLVEKGNELVLTNIEYCDFDKFGIEDKPLVNGEPYSHFSSNTNILFADLKVISSAVNSCPFPGLLVNLKKGVYKDAFGEKKEAVMARLESTMQNIADVFVEPKNSAMKTTTTFVTYNQRHKTISSAKKGYLPGGPLEETPENCLYDLLFAHRELLLSAAFHLPERRSPQDYLKNGPEFLFLYHPELGPLYSTIREKLLGGKIGPGSEWILEIAGVSIKQLELQGSLQIIAEHNRKEASCILENVRVENQGVDWSSSAPFWKMDLKRKESLKIILKGKSQFIAKNKRLKGNQTFVVEDGQVLEI